MEEITPVCNRLKNLLQHRKLRMPILMNRHYETPIIVLGKEGYGASADSTPVGATCNRLNLTKEKPFLKVFIISIYSSVWVVSLDEKRVWGRVSFDDRLVLIGWQYLLHIFFAIIMQYNVNVNTPASPHIIHNDNLPYILTLTSFIVTYYSYLCSS